MFFLYSCYSLLLSLETVDASIALHFVNYVTEAQMSLLTRHWWFVQDHTVTVVQWKEIQN